MRARSPFAVLVLSLCLAMPSNALPVVRIARAGADHHPAATGVSDTADYIRNSAIGDLFQIAAAKVALKTSHSFDVQRFSRMIIDDHTAMHDALTAALKRGEFSMTLPTSIDAQHDVVVTQLEDATPAEFDANFLQQQILANESALRVQMGYARNGRDLSLREFASQTIPRIRMHLALAERLFQQLSPKTASARH